MRALGTVIALLGCLLAPGITPVAATISSPLSVSEVTPVAPGVEHRRGTLSAKGGPATVNLISAELSDSIALHATNAFDRINAREAPTSQGLRHSREGHRVVATINGSNFSAPLDRPYQAHGLLVSNGEVTAAGFRRGGDQLVSFGVTADGRAFAGAPRMTITATLPDGTTAAIARVNQRLMPDEATLFTPRYDSSTKTTLPDVEVVLSGVQLPLRTSGSYSGTVSEVRLGVGDAPLGPDSLVVSALGTAATAFATLAVGDPLTIDVAIDAPWQDVLVAVGGREVLLRNGAIDIFPTNGDTFSTSHPRSALGVTAEGRILMVAVDGRQPHTHGLSVPEMAELMRDLGAVDAINLDGGGSTMLAARAPGDIEASIVNSPSSGIERTVSNALHVVSHIPTGPLAQVLVAPAQATLPLGSTRQFTLRGHDAAYNGIVPDVGPISWTTTNSDVAAVDADGVVAASGLGTASVEAGAGEWAAAAPVEVVPDPGVLTVDPPGVAIVPDIAAGKKALTLAVSWQASNPKADVTLVELQTRANGGAWVNIALPAGAPTSVTRRFLYNRLHEIRVRATDSAGNRSAWVAGTPFRLDLYNEVNPAIERLGSWRTIGSRKAIGRRFARSETTGSGLRLMVPGDVFAVIGQRSARGGAVDVGFEGGSMTTVDLAAPTMRRRVVVWVGEPPGATGLDALTIVDTSPTAPSRVDIDAVIVLRLGS